MKPAKLVQWKTLEGTVVKRIWEQVPGRYLYFFTKSGLRIMMLFTPLYSIFFEPKILNLEFYLMKSYTEVHNVLYKAVHRHIVYVTQMSVKFTQYFEI